MRLRTLALAISLTTALCLGGPDSHGHRLVGVSVTDTCAQQASTDCTTLLPSTVHPLDICSQHAPKCPLNEAYWLGEPSAWQYTAKRWQRHTRTPSEREVIWEWSAPHAGSNPAYAGYRENHYADFTEIPTGSPASSAEGLTYDWEVWHPDNGSLILHRYGGSSEAESLPIGEYDCTGGVHYPVVDQRVDHAWTPMCAMRNGECTCGGYIATQLIEEWGSPLSWQRSKPCDNPYTGIPAEESRKVNLICKISPHVGIVHQRYVLGQTASLPPSVGCEVVVYAWGWEKPGESSQGQAYETWFRNGEIRFSRWLNLSHEILDNIPDHDDDGWWNPKCDIAWSEITNAVYSGVDKIGSTVYTDTVVLPLEVGARISVSGGHLASAIDGISYNLPPGAFTDMVTLTHTIRFQEDSPALGPLVGIGRFYEIGVMHYHTRQPMQPVHSYTVTIEYAPESLGSAIGGTTALYYWDEGQWLREPTSVALTEANQVRTRPTHLSLWAVLGDTHRVFLPATLNSVRSGSSSE